MRYFVTSVFAISLLGSSAAMAQQVDCANPLTQSDMNICAADMYRAADGDLNLAYRMATAKAREMDQYVAAGEVTNLDMLRDAQRAWIPFRDIACSAESNLARGGSMQPLLFHTCLERLTRQRTQDLRFFGEVN